MEGRREFFGRATRGDKEGEKNKNRGVIEREGKGVVEREREKGRSENTCRREEEGMNGRQRV